MNRLIATFKLDDQLFGLDVLLVREINQHLDITPVPRARPFIRGLINLRGHIVTIFDLGVRVGLAPRVIGARSHVIVLKSNDELASAALREGRDDLETVPDKVGLLVDDIGEVLTIESGQCEPPPANVEGLGSRFVSEVVTLEETLLHLLNVQEVLKLEPAGQ